MSVVSEAEESERFHTVFNYLIRVAVPSAPVATDTSGASGRPPPLRDRQPWRQGTDPITTTTHRDQTPPDVGAPRNAGQRVDIDHQTPLDVEPPTPPSSAACGRQRHSTSSRTQGRSPRSGHAQGQCRSTSRQARADPAIVRDDCAVMPCCDREGWSWCRGRRVGGAGGRRERRDVRCVCAGAGLEGALHILDPDGKGGSARFRHFMIGLSQPAHLDMCTGGLGTHVGLPRRPRTRRTIKEIGGIPRFFAVASRPPPSCYVHHMIVRTVNSPAQGSERLSERSPRRQV